MNKIVPLMQREWLQHRFGWTLMVVVPLALALLLTAFGQVQLGDTEIERVGATALPAFVALATIAATTAVVFLIVWMGALIIVSGLARRDHADRSVEFWLSLPASHSASLASPLLVHLLLSPAVALLLGLAGGYAVSAVVVGRTIGFADWLALPWGHIVPATLAVLARLLVGLPLATLWLLPLILAIVVLTAWFGKWGWVLLSVGIGLGSLLLDRLFGAPLLSHTINSLLVNAGHALVLMSTDGLQQLQQADSAANAAGALPGWALHDAGLALRAAVSPLFAGALAFSAACFALLVQWRQRGAGAAD